MNTIKTTSLTETQDDLFAHLDASRIRPEHFGCWVALSQDRETIFWCPMNADGSPEREPTHTSWGEVTAPSDGFLEAINELYGTSFKYDEFAGR